MYKEVFPFNLVDLDNTKLTIPEFPTTKNKKSIIYFNGEPVEIKSKNKIIIIPFCDSSLFTPDITAIEKEMLIFARQHKISADEENCLHIIKSIKQYVYHGFAII